MRGVGGEGSAWGRGREREGACVEWESVRRALNKDLKLTAS